MDKIFRTMNLYSSINELLHPTLKNPNFLTPLLHFHGSNKISASDSELEFEFDNVGFQSSKPISQKTQFSKEELDCSESSKATDLKVRIDPWPEWMDFMECLSNKGYFERDRKPFLNVVLGSKELNCIRTACLDFARDRSKLIGYLSMKELQMIAGCGCPSIDRKVVNSGKRLRAHVNIDERNVCSSCNLQGECERAFVKAHGDGGRTVDVMRMLLFYGLDHITAMVENRPCLDEKANSSVRRLLKEIVEHSSGENESDLLNSNDDTSLEHLSDPRENHDRDASMKPGDWHCPKCNFHNFSRNTKCLRCGSLSIERLRKLHEDQADLPLKKGDWVCDKCNFLNFAKNSRCLQCKEKPLNRQLNPGEWECESCNYINFRKNMLCLKCDHRRPKSLNTPDMTSRPVVENRNYSFSKSRFSSDNAGGNPNLRHTSRKNDASLWRFVENDGEDHDDFKDPTFLDFPTLVNKSNLSQNAERRERRKSETLERRKGIVDAAEKEDDLILRSNNIERRLELIESADDDEGIAEWFGYRKPESER